MVISLVGFLSGTLQASEQRGALVLNKIPVYEFDDAGRIGCTGIYDVKFGQDVSDMRSDFPNNRNSFCLGRYEMTVRGEPGRTVTLYAQYQFWSGRWFSGDKKNRRPIGLDSRSGKPTCGSMDDHPG